MDDLSIVIPCYEEDHADLKQMVSSLKSLNCEVIVVDDGSQYPYPEAVKHGANFGYGSALMTGIKNATRPIIMTIDGDGQHTVGEVIRLYEAYKLMERPDMLIGVRTIKKENLIRYLGRKFLNWTASLICMHWLPDLNSGARIFKRDVSIGYFPILCRRFSFTTSITMCMMLDGYSVQFFPIKVENRTHGKSRVNVIRDGWVTLYYILKLGFAIRTRGVRAWLRSFRSLRSI